MILDDQKRKDLIIYRLEQAFINEKEILSHIENNYYLTAVNRIYYSLFYSLSALALLYKFETSKHNQLIGWFNKEFIYTKIFEKKLSRTATKLFEKRNKGDYEPFVIFEKEEVIEMFVDMKEFIETIKKFILSKL